jgi:hypothetical protein
MDVPGAERGSERGQFAVVVREHVPACARRTATNCRPCRPLRRRRPAAIPPRSSLQSRPAVCR